MSHNIFNAGNPELYVTTFVGPEWEQKDRKRWQFTAVAPDGVAVLTRAQVLKLIERLQGSVA